MKLSPYKEDQLRNATLSSMLDQSHVKITNFVLFLCGVYYLFVNLLEIKPQLLNTYFKTFKTCIQKINYNLGQNKLSFWTNQIKKLKFHKNFLPDFCRFSRLMSKTQVSSWRLETRLTWSQFSHLDFDFLIS